MFSDLPCLFRFPAELNVGHVSASVLWERLSADVQATLEQHASDNKPKDGSDYVNLQLKIAHMYKKYVADVPPYKGARQRVVSDVQLL